VVRRLAVFVAVVLVVAACAEAGAWFVPFLLGVVSGGLRGVVPLGASRLVAGVASARLGFPAVPLAALAAAIGWAIPLWAMALAGLPSGATARAIAGLAGLPPHAAVTVVVTLLLAALQVFVGAWLARALVPRR
jgi:hypothetical protein